MVDTEQERLRRAGWRIYRAGWVHSNIVVYLRHPDGGKTKRRVNRDYDAWHKIPWMEGLDG